AFLPTFAVAENLSAAPPTEVSKPLADVTPHFIAERNRWCGTGYTALPNGPVAIGPTEIAFKIEPDGSVRDVEVIESSGWSVGDRVVVQCARGWHYEPLPHELSWRVSIFWNGNLPPIPSGAPHECPNYLTTVAHLPGSFHESVLFYTVRHDGTVTNV